MRVFSRNMPPPNKAMGWSSSVLLLLAILALPGLAWLPLAIVFPCIFFLMSGLQWSRAAIIAKNREGESICTFARSFDRTATDPWIVRAVYEEFSGYCQYPIRRTDRFSKGLCIDDEELDDCIESVAHRAQRCLKNTENNPMYGKIEKVGDLVEFLQDQPRL